MRTVSTGVGLCVLGVCVLGAAALSSPRLGNTAIAAGGAQRNPPTNSSNQQVSETLNAIASTSCYSTPTPWFSATPRLLNTNCGDGIPLLPLSPADVNGDGITELFSPATQLVGFWVEDPMGDFSGQICCTQTSGSFPNCPPPFTGRELPSALTAFVVNAAEGSALASKAIVLDLPREFGDALTILVPDPGYPVVSDHHWRMAIGQVGWLDCDLDGDLDLVFRIDIYRKRSYGGCGWLPQEFWSSKYVFLENIGHQRNPNPADLDGNGSVDGGDLSWLLLNWSN